MSTELKQQVELKKGEARCPGAPSTQDIIAGDRVAAPAWVRSESYEFLGDEDIPTDRYIDPAYAKLELERLWTRTWQFACREEHIPEVGDYYVYDIGPYSFIVTRVGKDEVRAYYNACLHRGTKLSFGSDASKRNQLLKLIEHNGDSFAVCLCHGVDAVKYIGQ